MFGMKYTCSACGISYRSKEEFDDHNTDVHDGDAGAVPG